MSAFLVSLIFSAGASAWIYSRTMSQTGGNNKSSLAFAGVSGAAIFIVMMIVLSFILR